MTQKPAATHTGTVQRVIKSPVSREPEKAEIAVEGADHLYKEIRIENTLKTADGKPVALKQGAEVEVIIEADPKDTKPKA